MIVDCWPRLIVEAPERKCNEPQQDWEFDEEASSLVHVRLSSIWFVKKLSREEKKSEKEMNEGWKRREVLNEASFLQNQSVLMRFLGSNL